MDTNLMEARLFTFRSIRMPWFRTGVTWWIRTSDVLDGFEHEPCQWIRRRRYRWIRSKAGMMDSNDGYTDGFEHRFFYLALIITWTYGLGLTWDLKRWLSWLSFSCPINFGSIRTRTKFIDIHGETVHNELLRRTVFSFPVNFLVSRPCQKAG